MMAHIKKIIMFLNLVINHGISPSTILSNGKPLNSSYGTQLHKGQNEHGM
jgi:hypothetical protein